MVVRAGPDSTAHKSTPDDIPTTSGESSISWQDGIKHLFSSYFSNPRMWPIGYILDSGYSPLRLERDIPSRNWRDAFEDLLCIEAGKPMVREEDRKAENEFAALQRHKFINAVIAEASDNVKRNDDFQARTRELRQERLKTRDTNLIKHIDSRLLPLLRTERDECVTEAQEAKKEFEAQRDATASALKPRGQWIASLITSGALPAWFSRTHTSVDGTVMCFNRLGDAGPDTGIVCSELELINCFEKGQPFAIGSPAALPPQQVKVLTDGSITYESPARAAGLYHHLRPAPTSTLEQYAYSEPLKLSDGFMGHKVILKNVLANGGLEIKEFVQEPAKVLENVENTRNSLRILCGMVLEMSGSEPTELERAVMVVMDKLLEVEVMPSDEALLEE